jgi:uncharacterized protein YndB with AHSA1/START domain
MNTTRISVQAIIAANTKKVWDYYTRPEHITKWNFASDDWQCPSATNDMRVGGKYSSRMEAKDGSWGFDFEAIYDEVVAHENFTYTMTDGRKVTTRFENQGNTTNVITTFDAEHENPIDLQRDGWQAILDNFKKYVKTH